MQLLKLVLACFLQTFRCAAPLENSLLKPKGKPQHGVILIALMGSIEFGGAAHRNMKLDCWELDFTGDNNVSLRCSF